MKRIVLFICLILSTYVFPQNGYYNWINQTPAALVSTLGEPAQIMQSKSADTMYVYQTELGYRSFFVKNGLIFKTNNTTYWKSKTKAKSAYAQLITFYQDDGFSISKKKDSADITNSIYSIKLETYYEEGYHAVSETATLLKKEE